ncbi:MAG: FHA domain-containing protein [Clostridiales bacterium]|nr:FHA domain-containing protein [Clostridiales bacterium]
MEITYKKDLHNSYLVVTSYEEKADEAYCVKMLGANAVVGIIKPDRRIIDGQLYYYFDITSKQSLDVIYNKGTINYEKAKSLYMDLLDIITKAYEYLLNENDLILDPEHVYIELSTNQVYVPYLPGYNKKLKNQITSLIEYTMNKLEYKDKEAVLYVYNLHSISKEEGASFNNLSEAIRKDKQESKVIPEPVLKEHREQSAIKQIPIMMEKISDDKEQYYYPLKIYIYTGICILIAIFIIIFCFLSKIIYTSLGNRIDYAKLTFLIIILGCILAYLMKVIWDKRNRLTRIIQTDKYIDPRYEEDNLKENYEMDNKSTNRIKDLKTDALNNNKSDEEMIYGPQTVLLNSKEAAIGCCLEPEREDVYETIYVHEFPFVIGKQENNVDYFLNNQVVSRYHVKISKEDNKYYITDLNSTNGTSINDIKLFCYQRHEVSQGDKVDIAGIKYKFRLLGSDT